MKGKQTQHVNSAEMVERLVEENYKLIFHIVNTFAQAGSIERRDFDDATWYAIDGLLKAAQSFDASRGFSFSTYAYTSIKNSVIAFIRDKQRYLKHHQVFTTFKDKDDQDVDFFDNLEDMEEVEDERQKPRHQRDPLSLLLEKDRQQQIKKTVEEIAWSGNETINVFIDLYYRDEEDVTSQQAIGKLYGKTQASISNNLRHIKQADELLSRTGVTRDHFTLDMKEVQYFKRRLQSLA